MAHRSAIDEISQALTPTRDDEGSLKVIQADAWAGVEDRRICGGRAVAGVLCRVEAPFSYAKSMSDTDRLNTQFLPIMIFTTGGVYPIHHLD